MNGRAAAPDEPGARDADAGTAPGHFDAGGARHGSRGCFNSAPPRDGRSFSLSLRMGF